MIKVKRIDHVAIAVRDRDGSCDALASLFGLHPGAREHVPGKKTDVAFLHADAAAEVAFELIAPAGNEGLERFLTKRGPGLHHICFEVDDLPATLASLKAAGVRLIDDVPRPGARADGRNGPGRHAERAHEQPGAERGRAGPASPRG